MSTVLLSGVGQLGGWALELLARSEGVERVVTLKRSPWPGQGPSWPTVAMLGSAIEGHTKRFEHHQVDLADEPAVARLLATVRPDVIVHSATVQSPRRFMGAEIEPARRAEIRRATFGMWLPWHLWPAAQLMRAIERAGIETHVVNASFPDVVNVALWRHFGHGPTSGAGNVEVCAARVLRYVMATTGRPAEEIDVSLVGSHALLAYGPEVPHHLQVTVTPTNPPTPAGPPPVATPETAAAAGPTVPAAGAGQTTPAAAADPTAPAAAGPSPAASPETAATPATTDITAEVDLAAAFAWPEPIDWGRADVFSLFAASAVKNALALLRPEPTRTHVTAPLGLPGGYPAEITNGTVHLRLPPDLTEPEAIAINDQAARFDGIDHIEPNGTIHYTPEARVAMEHLGYHCEAVTFADIPQRCHELQTLYDRLTAKPS